MPDHDHSISRPDAGRQDLSGVPASGFPASGFPSSAERPVARLDSRLELWIAGILIRLDALRDRTWVGFGLTLLCLGSVGSLWWIGRPTEPPAVELNIPMVDSETPSSDEVGELADGEIGRAADGATQSDTTVGTKAKLSTNTPGDESPGEAPAPVVVHVSGAVKRQGLVSLPATARIADAVAAAGGPLESADTHQLNLAARVADGQHIRVPAFGDDETGPLVVGGVSGPGSVAGTEGTIGVAVNINTADQSALESLPGIGPAIASAIVQWRNDNGRFETADDLLLVSGIGPAKLSSIRDLVTT